jgi:hypothetical protein
VGLYGVRHQSLKQGKEFGVGNDYAETRAPSDAEIVRDLLAALAQGLTAGHHSPTTRANENPPQNEVIVGLCMQNLQWAGFVVEAHPRCATLTIALVQNIGQTNPELES